MTLKISCIKLIREDIRHRGWAAALSSIVLLLMMPVYTVLYLSKFSGVTPGSSELAYLVSCFPGMFNGSNVPIFAAGIGALAVLLALTGFGYIHSREKLDLYHSLPVRRSRWFVAVYLSGLLMFLVPYIICSALTMAAGASKGIMSPGLAADCASAVLAGILAWLVIYTACVFAVMLTGRTAIGLLASLVVIVLPFMMFFLLSSLQTAFFESYYTLETPLSQRLADYLSPLGIFSSLITLSGNGELGVSVPAAAVILTAVLFTAALFLYRAYPSEAAGNALAFPLISPVVKVVVCIPASLFAGLMAQTLIGITDSSWICLMSLLAALVICGIIEFLYTMDLRTLLKGWRSSLISIGAVLAILSIFRFDLLGYDTYMPDEDRLEGISFYPDSFSGYFSYPDEALPSESSLGYYVPVKDMDLVYTLAQSGIQNLKDGLTPDMFYSADETDIPEGYLPAVFRYRTSGGRTVLRQYTVSKKETEETLTQLLEDQEYRKQLFPVFHVDRDKVVSLQISDIYGQNTNLNLDRQQMDALLDAYENDVMKVSADTLINGKPIGELIVELPYTETDTETGVTDTASSYNSARNTFLLPMLYIYPGYDDTMALLQEYGCPLSTEIDPADVSSVMLSLSQSTIDSGSYDDMLHALSDTAELEEYEESTDITVTSEEDIALVLDQVDGYYIGILDLGSASMDYVNIYYKDGNFYGYSF